MQFEIELPEPDRDAPAKTATTIGASYVLGGIVPLLPFFFVPMARDAVSVSIVFSSIALFLFGATKVRSTANFAAPIASL